MLGIFGGTFDPIHLGHVETVTEVADKLALTRIKFIPAFRPPHRDAPETSAHHRLAMIKLALNGYKNFEADDRETRRGTRSYTVETLETLHQEGEKHLCFILGLDAFLKFETWHRWRDILGLANIAVMTRPGFKTPQTKPEWWREAEVNNTEDFKNTAAGAIYPVPVTPHDIAATSIRQNISAGIDVSNKLTEGVWGYIRENKLYGFNL